MKFQLFLIFILINIFRCQVIFAQDNYIALVKGEYDNVERVLDIYGIKYDSLELKDLHDLKILKKYQCLFLPCGFESALEGHIRVYANGHIVRSVNLEKGYSVPKRDLIQANLGDFIKSGGWIYFSGCSYSYVPDFGDFFSFHQDFPWSGMPCRISSRLERGLSSACSKDTHALYVDFSGWIALKGIEKGMVLSTGIYETPFGQKEGPLSAIFTLGSGGFLYTSLYSSVYSDYRRFHVCRIAGTGLVNRLIKEADSRWQDAEVVVADALRRGENSRTLKIDKNSGPGTIYFISENEGYHIDLFDSEGNLYASVNKNNFLNYIDLKSDSLSLYMLKIYPPAKSRGMFAVVYAGGKPRNSIVIYLSVAGIIIVFFGLLCLYRFKFS